MLHNYRVIQGFIQDFSTGSSISASVQPPRLHEVGGGDYASTDLIGPLGSRGLPIMHCTPNIKRKSESMSEIIGFVSYFRGGSRIFHLRSTLGTLHSQKILKFSNQFPAFWWDLKDFYLTLILLMLLLSMAIK